MKPPQALTTTYATRIATFSTALITPAGLNPTSGAPGATPVGERTSGRTKRGTTVINYAEVDGDDDLEVDGESNAGQRGSNALIVGAGPPQNGLGTNSMGNVVEAIKRPVQIPGRPAQPRSSQGLYRTEHQLLAASNLPSVLVPIRLDFDLDPPSRGRIHDSFLWNLNETLITPDNFAITTCVDLDLPLQPYASMISAAIRDQISEYAPVATIPISEESGEMRVVCNLNVNLGERVYTDKFEWDLTGGLSPEYFAKSVAADLGLTGEFIPAIAHAIYEFCLQKKKDLCETGITPELENDAHRPETEAGWRVDLESLGAEWESRVETLTREEIDKREGDREREIRRLRRDTARLGGTPGGVIMPSHWGPGASNDVGGEEQMGRGSRVKRKRQRSFSPPARGTPTRTPSHQQGNGINGSGGILNGGLTEWEKQNWRCSWCFITGTGTWGVREGPDGPKTLCHNCGQAWMETGVLPEWAKGLHMRQ
ncbi:unnamed protein product [Tuber melanosporum]|uniref:(Perigord truffle) hypothetical protein n=1 Tax=Tuber melanosporum (strain Mel28) TaxID=656061 RepID=D5GJX5_TUBMM|nr:uncharacterized protein GSTUM_00009257001 [Tuber melanosporum]CAZ84818.1 unnamed protein product [Tuber melanosporum]